MIGDEQFAVAVEPKPVMLNVVSASSLCQVTFVPSCLMPQMRPVEWSP